MKKGLVLLLVSIISLLMVATLVMAAQDSPPVDWVQTNTDGFGDPLNGIHPLAVFNDQMYAGTWNGQIWRTSDGWNWGEFTPSWTISNTAVFDLEVFGTNLYMGTDGPGGGEVWRTDGTNWSRVSSGGFGKADNTTIINISVFSNTIYAATANEITGIEIWRSATGNIGSWEEVHNCGTGTNGQYADVTMDVYNDYLYLGIVRNDVGELWRTSDGSTWDSVFTDGLGTNNTQVSAMAEFDGNFYIGLRNTTTGGEVWRSSNGVNWTTVFAGGLGNVENSRPYGLFVYDDNLYLVFSNTVTGAEVWVSSDGVAWQNIVTGGWGDINNGYADYFDKGAVVFNSKLYVATLNTTTGGEVWRYEPVYKIFLPAILDNYAPPGASIWSEFNSPTTEILNSVDMVSATDGWAVGRGGAILRFNGIEWVQITSPVMANFYSVSMSSSNNGWLVGQDTTTYDEVVLRWDGTSWNPVSLPVDFFGASDVSAPDSTTAWFSLGYALCTPICEGDQGGVLNWWNGSSWGHLSTTPQHIGPDSISMVDANYGWVVGSKYIPATENIESSILHWNGATWTETSHPNVWGLNAVDTSDLANAWAVGGGGNILHWNGVDWSVVPTSGYPNLNAVDIVSDIDVWAVGRSTIQHWNGTAWEEVTNPVTEVLNSVSMVSDNEGWAVGENGTILYYGPELP